MTRAAASRGRSVLRRRWVAGVLAANLVAAASGIGVATDPAGVASGVFVVLGVGVLVGLVLAVPWARSAARTSAGRTLRTE